MLFDFYVATPSSLLPIRVLLSHASEKTLTVLSYQVIEYAPFPTREVDAISVPFDTEPASAATCALIVTVPPLLPFFIPSMESVFDCFFAISCTCHKTEAVTFAS